MAKPEVKKEYLGVYGKIILERTLR